jgi:Flp pilus assembly protein TadD
LCAFAVFTLLASCSRNATSGIPERIALLPFENLTGDASLDWLSAAAPVIVGEQLATSRKLTTLRAPSVSDTLGGRPTRLLHATFERRGNALRFAVSIEDAASHKMVDTPAFQGDFLNALGALATHLDPAAQPFSTANPAAAVAWGEGHPEQAVALDSDFGAAWMAWTEQLAASRQQTEASAVAARALARPALKTPLNRARLQLAKAVLDRDENLRREAMQALSTLVPDDPSILNAQAEQEQRERHFAPAAAAYRKILALDPNNAAIMNSLGYAEGEAGNLEAARQALENYGKQAGQAPNSLDSLGEIYFMNGRFAEARQYFEQANKANPAFLDGAPLAKAAYAQWFAGDRNGADATMKQYLVFRSKQNDTTVFWREATWLYATGRRDQALAKLGEAPPALATMAERQRAVWRGEVKPPEDTEQLRNLYLGTNPAADGLPRTLYAAALLRSGKKDEAKTVLQQWPLPESAGDPLLQSLVYPLYLELREKLQMK